MKRFKIAPLVILLSLGGCTPNTNNESYPPESRPHKQWSAVTDSDKAFSGFENALRPYLLDDRIGYYFYNGTNTTPLVSVDFETDEDLFSSSSSAPSNKESKVYTVELYGIGETTLLDCTKEHGFKASTTFNANKMSVISEGNELTSIKQLFKTHLAETKISDDADEYEQGLYTDLTKASMSKFLIGHLLGQDDGIEDKTFIDVSSVFPDSFVFADAMEEALTLYIATLKEWYKEGNVSIQTDGDIAYKMEIAVTDKNAFGDLLREIASKALEGFSNPLVSSLSFDTYIDSILETIDSLNGCLTIYYYDGMVYPDDEAPSYESDLGLIEYDFEAKMKDGEPSSSSAEESTDFDLKSITFDGTINLVHGELVRDDGVPNDLLDHNVWKELDY